MLLAWAEFAGDVRSRFSLSFSILYFFLRVPIHALLQVCAQRIYLKSHTPRKKKAHSLARSRFSSVLAIWISIEHNTARKHRKAGERIDFLKKLQKNSKNSKNTSFQQKLSLTSTKLDKWTKQCVSYPPQYFTLPYRLLSLKNLFRNRRRNQSHRVLLRATVRLKFFYSAPKFGHFWGFWMK